jgi:hypothetical protein
MAQHLWLVNGKTALLGHRRKHMKTRRHKNRRRHRRAAARLGNPGRKHSHRRAGSRRARRGWRLFNPGPDVVHASEGLAAAMLAGGAGYVASKLVGIAADTWLPQTVPYRSLIGTAGAAIITAIGAEKFMKSRPKVAGAMTVGATIPVVEEVLAMTPVGPYIGVVSSESADGSPAALPSPGMGASLRANLRAALAGPGDGDEDVNYAVSY